MVDRGTGLGAKLAGHCPRPSRGGHPAALPREVGEQTQLHSLESYCATSGVAGRTEENI